MSTTEFVIVPRGPFSLARAADVVAHFPPLRHQPKFADGVLRLGFIADRTFDPIAVTIRTADYLGVLRVEVHGLEGKDLTLNDVRKQVARILALDIDGTAFPELALRDPRLAELMKEYEGLRPVSFVSPYECACWAILSQRISTAQAANIVKALVEAHGPKIDASGVTLGVFPPPQKLLELTEIESVPAVKMERLHGIAQAALDGKLDAATLRALPEDEAIRRLLELPGIGDFWSAGIWLRACGVHDRFPDEPIARDALKELHDGKPPPDPTALYRPFGMWITFMLRVANRRSSESPYGRHEASTRRRGPRAA